MKRTDIQGLGIYTDGKLGLRQVLALGSHIPTSGIDPDAIGVSYQVLSASLAGAVGTTGSMEIGSFASWAKNQVPQDAIAAFTLKVEAGRIAVKLTPTQRAFLLSIDSDATTSSSIECQRDEMRAIKSCTGKGLVVPITIGQRDQSFDIQLTALGIAVLQHAYAMLKAE